MIRKVTMLKLRKETVRSILNTNDEINRIKDVDSLLDRVLYEARRYANADAGSIFLVEGNKLKFSFVQNDSIITGDRASQYLYMNQEIAIDDRSIAGYVALKLKPVIIRDAYRLSAVVPYGFNRSFDEMTSYRTRSVLAVPLITSQEKLIGVMQIINALDTHHNVVPFTAKDRLYVTYFAGHAATAIEKAKMTREIILRMIRIAELRDPGETGAHVNRVGAYSIEVYSKWAANHGIEEAKIKRIRDILRIAAMLHDVGKVAISDVLLHKIGRLNNKEFEQVKWHPVYGARLFCDSASDWDDMASEIALNHHERWDGTGYPGTIENLRSVTRLSGLGKKGIEIPLFARIVALVDVYDALISQRIYKKGWPESKVLAYIREQKGEQFDPELVDVFFSIYHVIQAIHAKYAET
jgi:HD-GYP domain-containing protein (c-di-GMP phosphodiesterase class II)